jgi:hypothetical protein
MAFGECAAGTTFQILFKIEGFAFIREGKITCKTPRPVRSRGGILSRVMARETSSDICSEAHVVARWNSQAFQEVDVVHSATMKRNSLRASFGKVAVAGILSGADGDFLFKFRASSATERKPSFAEPTAGSLRTFCGILTAIFRSWPASRRLGEGWRSGRDSNASFRSKLSR